MATITVNAFMSNNNVTVAWALTAATANPILYWQVLIQPSNTIITTDKLFITINNLPPSSKTSNTIVTTTINNPPLLTNNCTTTTTVTDSITLTTPQTAPYVSPTKRIVTTTVATTPSTTETTVFTETITYYMFIVTGFSSIGLQIQSVPQNINAALPNPPFASYLLVYYNRTIQYDVVKSVNLPQLQSLVSCKLNDGWLLSGDITIMRPANGTIEYFQTIMRTNELMLV